jgi:hypothetical protein
LEAWLLENPDKLEMAIADMRATIAFLRQNNIIHFDTDWGNILTDGARAYLSDFGLTLDRSFALSPEEAAFFDQHLYYDNGLFLSDLDFHLVSLYRKLPDSAKSKINQQYDLGNESKFDEISPVLLNNIEEIVAQRLMLLPPSYLATVVKYREIILLVSGFYAAMRSNPKKDTKFDHEKLTQLLQETGYLISPTLL